MTSTLERQIHDAMTKFLIEQGVHDVARVTSFTEDNYTWGCSTCGDSQYEVTMYYDKISGTTGHYDYSGSFADLIRELT